MKNDIRIDDEKEFMKQKEKYIYDSQQYVELKILVGSGDTVPISILQGEHTSIEDIARLVCAIKNQLHFIAKEYPTAFLIAEQMVSTDYGKITLEEGGTNDEE